MTDYTKNLTAEELIRFIATDYVELSYSKAVDQRNEFIKICREWLEHNEKLPDTDPIHDDSGFLDLF